MKAHLQGGFTLIELITVITIMALLSTLGIASFITYNRTQELSSATQDVVTMLQMAKASAVSQVKPSSCNATTLNGYQVTIDPNVESFAIAPLCNNVVDVVNQKKSTLTKNVIFSPSSTQTIIFHTVTGNVTISPGSSSIILQHTQASIQKTISVKDDGRIQVQ